MTDDIMAKAGEMGITKAAQEGGEVGGEKVAQESSNLIASSSMSDQTTEELLGDGKDLPPGKKAITNSMTNNSNKFIKYYPENPDILNGEKQALWLEPGGTTTRGVDALIPAGQSGFYKVTDGVSFVINPDDSFTLLGPSDSFFNGNAVNFFQGGGWMSGSYFYFKPLMQNLPLGY